MTTQLKGLANVEVASIAVRFVRAARESTGLSQEDFAIRCGLKCGTLTSYELASLTFAPKLEALARIAFGASDTFTIKQGNEIVFRIHKTKSRANLLNQLFEETKRLTKECRTRANQTQKDFALARGFNQNQISAFEKHGRNLAQTSPLALESIVKLLGCEPRSISLGFGD